MTIEYIFGYGSLINKDSRARSGHTGKAIPVIVDGIERAWNLPSPQYKLTALGANINPQLSINGVVVPIEKEEIPNFDKREEGYTRHRINSKNLRTLDESAIPETNIWIYIPDKVEWPDSSKPIVQSYVDVIVQGCLAFGDGFTRDFIRGTKGWNNPWINDRNQPNYPRPIELDSEGRKKIDLFLEEIVFDAFSRRINL